MKKQVVASFLSLFLLLSSCGAPSRSTAADDTFTVAAMTYPIYLFASRVAAGAEGTAVETVINQSMSCLHDYTLTTSDMKLLQGADLLLLNGVGLEDSMSSAISSSGLPTADCSAGVPLLHYGEDSEEHADHGQEEHDDGHDSHDHGEYDPHIWMDPERAAVMVDNIAKALAQADPKNSELYRANASAYAAELTSLAAELREKLAGVAPRELITFHEGFGYFADSMGFTVLKSIEEEAGSEASARELTEISALVREHRLPAIFMEINGSDATAKAVVRETGTALARLSMLMSADAAPQESDDPYRAGMEHNADAIVEAYG